MMRKLYISLIALGLAACGADAQNGTTQDADGPSAAPGTTTAGLTGIFATPNGPMELPYAVVDGKNVLWMT